MAKHLRRGDKVRWATSQGETHGRIKKVVKAETRIQRTRLKGSADDPVYVVESDKTGKRAGHKEQALRKE